VVRRCIRHLLFLLIVGVGVGVGVANQAAAATGPLRVSAQNRRYFADASGAIVYLSGSHTWQTLKDRGLTDPPTAFNFNGFLDFLVAHNHNFFRLWTWEQPHSLNYNTDNLKRFFVPFPWQRTGPGVASDGKPKFNFDLLDQAYFDRIRARVSAAAARRIYVAITLFDGWDVFYAYNAQDGGFPYAGGNNVNGVASDGPGTQTLANTAVTAIQEAYVRKVIDTVNDLDNVLYEIANESGSGAANISWQYHMIDFIKAYQSGKPKQHPVGMTSCLGPDSQLFGSHADWISPGARLVASDGSKVIINDTDHSYSWTELKADGVTAQRAWAWKTFTTGGSPAFMDPYLEAWPGRNSPSGASVDQYWEPLRSALGQTRTYADKLDLKRALPSSVCSTGYCLVEPGAQYLVYQPSSGAFTVSMLAGSYRVEWFNPATAAVAAQSTLTTGAGVTTFTPPFSGDAVLLLSKQSPVPSPATTPRSRGALAVLLLLAGCVSVSKSAERLGFAARAARNN
jgi:hypothetical protein